MKLNLPALRKKGWHISFERDAAGIAGEVIELHPPAMKIADYEKLRELVGANLQGDAMAMDLVLQQFLLAMHKAAFLAVISE